MKILDIDQRTDEWDAIRGVMPTASHFSEILSNTGKVSASQTKYMNSLLAYGVMGKKDAGAGFTNAWMDRGTEMEEEACGYYEMRMDVDVDLVGFCVHDSGLFGCSPDGLLPNDGGLEIKCPSAPVHISYLLNDQKMPTTYIAQVQGSMLVTGREWWDFMSYHPDMEPLIIRVYKDYAYCEKLYAEILKFSATMEEKSQTLIERGYKYVA